ncbi:MAG: three-Cys-motif partner protein TcmP [Bacteriovorax sp.]
MDLEDSPKDKKRFKRLEEVIFPYTSKLKINSYNSDANEVIPDICTKVNWKKTRAVLFLDPYGLSVEWKTLETIKNTNSIDVWYLFPTFATYRNISNTPEETELYKQKKITTLLGTEEWKNHAFGIKKDCHSLKQFDLMTEFADHKDQEKLEKIIGVSDLEVFVKERLGALFPYVTEPLPLLSAKGLHMFSLFMCVSNSSQPAINLAKKVANHILKSH